MLLRPGAKQCEAAPVGKFEDANGGLSPVQGVYNECLEAYPAKVQKMFLNNFILYEVEGWQ